MNVDTLLIGQRYLEEGLYRQALEAFTRCLRETPDHIEALTGRISARLYLDDILSADADLSRLLALLPEPGRYFQRGRLRQNLGNPRGAIADYSHAIELEPQDHIPYWHRALSRREINDLPGALFDLNAAVRLAPENSYMHHLRGVVLDELGDADGALASFAEALRLAPESASAWWSRALVLVRREARAEALFAIDRVIELGDTRAEVFYLRATLRQELGDLAGAIEDLDRVLHGQAQSYEATIKRADARALAGDAAGAIADFCRAFAIDPTQAYPVSRRSQLHRELGDLESAIEDETLLIRLDPTDAIPWYNRGIMRHRTGDRRGALADYDRVLATEPGHAYALTNRAAVRNELDDPIGALRDLEDAMTAGDDTPAPHLSRARVHAALGNWLGAASAYDAAMALGHDELTTVFDRGMAWLEADEFERAIEDFSAVIAKDPEAPEPWANRGRARLGAGRFAEAESDYDEALRRQPNDGPYYFNRSLARAGRGAHASAIADLGLALECLDAERRPNALVQRAHMREAIGDLRGALADFEAVERIWGESPQLLTHRARLLLALGDTPPAERALESALAQDASIAEAHRLMATIERERGDVNEAERSLATARALEPEDDAPLSREALISRAEQREALGVPYAALADLDAALAIAPDDLDTALRRARLLLSVEAYPDALAACDAVLSHRPEHRDALEIKGHAQLGVGMYDDAAWTFSRLADDVASAYFRAYALGSAGRWEEALEAYDELIRREPGDPRYFALRADVREHLGDDAGALEDFTAALALDAQQIHLRYRRGLACARLGDMDAAMADWVAAADAGHPLAHRQRARRLLETDQPGEALRAASHVIRLQPDDAEAFLDRAVIRQALGDESGALEDAERARQLASAWADPCQLAGELLEDLGELDRAEACYGEAIRLDPDEAMGYVRRARLRERRENLLGAAEDVTHLVLLDVEAADAYMWRARLRHRAGLKLHTMEDYMRGFRLKREQPDQEAKP